MGGFDNQLMVAKETTWNTPVTVTKGFGYNGDPAPVKPVPGTTEGNPIRPGSRYKQSRRIVPYVNYAEGHIDLDWMTKDMSFWLEHLLGTVGTTGSGPYVHTGTEGTTSALKGKSFTLQTNNPFHPAATDQAMTFSGGKVPQWSIGCDVDGMLVLGLDLWFGGWTTATAKATYAETASLNNFAWSHGAITIGGAAIALHSFSLEVNQNMDLSNSHRIGTRVEPPLGIPQATLSMEADWESLTQFNRVHATSVASRYAQVVGTWTNGTDIVTITGPEVRFDDLDFGGDRGALTQEVTASVESDGTNSPISIAVTSSQATP